MIDGCVRREGLWSRFTICFAIAFVASSLLGLLLVIFNVFNAPVALVETPFSVEGLTVGLMISLLQRITG